MKNTKIVEDVFLETVFIIVDVAVLIYGTLERDKNMASNKIKIITNESGDWEIVRYEDFEASGHRLDIWDYRNLLEFLGYQVEVSEISDEEMEQIS